MVNAVALNRYKKVQIESATPARLLRELLARLYRDFDDARRAIHQRDVKAKADALGHALRILEALQASLDANIAPELSENLEAIYQFAWGRLLLASARLETSYIDEAQTALDPIREAFEQVIETLEQG